MKSLTTASIFGLMLILASCGGNSTQETEKAPEMSAEKVITESDKLNSGVAIWEGSILGMYSHSGTIDAKVVDFKTKGNHIYEGRVVFDMTTIAPTDENYQDEEGKTKQDLVNHLKSADFFDVENYPEASFVVSSVADDGAVTGKMTVKGQSHEETFSNIGTSDGGIKAKISFSRSKYGISFNHPSKDMVLSDDISVMVKIGARP